MVIENWADIRGYEGLYQVSDQGRVKSVGRLCIQWNGSTNCRRTLRERLLKPGCTRSGYVEVVLCKQGVPTHHSTHRLVLEAFVSACPLGMEACHNNGVRADNRLVNLRWATRADNHKDRRRHGTLPQGEDNPASKLTIEEVTRLRALHHSGRSQKYLRGLFGISKAQVNKIVNRKSWAHA